MNIFLDCRVSGYILNFSVWQALYHVLGVLPAYQASIGSALNELCLGLKADEVAPVCGLMYMLSLLFNMPPDLAYMLVFIVSGFTRSICKRCSCENGLLKCSKMHSFCV